MRSSKDNFLNFYPLIGLLIMVLLFQCEREFHVGCLKDHEMGDFKVIRYLLFYFWKIIII